MATFSFRRPTSEVSHFLKILTIFGRGHSLITIVIPAVDGLVHWYHQKTRNSVVSITGGIQVIRLTVEIIPLLYLGHALFLYVDPHLVDFLDGRKVDDYLALKTYGRIRLKFATETLPL